MGKKFMMRVQVLHCIACHSKDTLIKLNDGVKSNTDIRICKSCFNKLSNNQTIITPNKNHKLYRKNGVIMISENVEEIAEAANRKEGESNEHF
jgi:hypothetical protein